MDFSNLIAVFFFHLTPDQVILIAGFVVLLWFVFFAAWEWILFIDPALREENQIYFDPQYQWRRRW
jgi:type IV secretory pathway TrbD component